MEKTKKQASSSFTAELFGPKDSSPPSSSTGLFGSVFGPPSTGLGKNSSHSGSGSTSKHTHTLGSQYANPIHGTTDYMTQRGKGENGGMHSKDRGSIYHNETVEPCYFNSSIYYGGQEVYSPNAHSSASQHTFKKDEGNDDPNGSSSNSASRGNWWQGSLYY